MPLKQVIVARRDLNMPPGKLAAQVAHASISFLTKRLEPTHFYNRNVCKVQLMTCEREWLDQGFTKIVLGVDSEEELEAIAAASQKFGFETHRIVDSGLTCFNGVHTFTCVGIGPHYDWMINDITGKLRLY